MLFTYIDTAAWFGETQKQNKRQYRRKYQTYPAEKGLNTHVVGHFATTFT